MVPNPDKLIGDFVSALNHAYSQSSTVAMIQHQLIKAPHTPPDLPENECGVYVFSLTSTSAAKAGPNRTLKVGRIGVNSAPRFKYQHYTGAANSTVSGALGNNRILWGYLGVPDATTDVGEWLKGNTDRDHFLLDGADAELVPFLEVYLKGVLGPALEGSLKNYAANVGMTSKPALPPK